MNHSQARRRAPAAVVIALAVLMTAAISALPYGGAQARELTARYATYDLFHEAASELNLQIASEGAVLLKNDNAALPLTSDERDVSVFHSYYNPGEWSDCIGYMMVSGGGSGNIWVPEGKRTVYEGLEASGFTYNKVLKGVYDAYDGTGHGFQNAACGIDGPDVAKLAPAEFTYPRYDDAAIVTISRLESESIDVYEPHMGDSDYVYKRTDPDEHYLQLRDKERALIDYVEARFDKVIVVLNTGMPLEIAELQDDDKVDSILWVGYGGENGLLAIGELLSGRAAPSGKTVDTWAADFAKDPTYRNFGDNSQTSGGFTKREDGTYDFHGNNTVVDPDGAATAYRSVDYEEGIYVGYKFYETAASVGYFDGASAASLPDGVTDKYYNRESGVVYPFGYGLTYTEFTREIVAGTTVTSGDAISFDVKVTNTGRANGKDVAEVYYDPVYTPGGLEKATANLVAFAKTKELRPGESDTLKISFAKRDMASYDVAAVHADGKKGAYVLEAGEYTISLNTDSHTKVASFVYDQATEAVFDKDGKTQRPVENLFSNADCYNVDRSRYTSGALGFMTRQDFKGTFPAAPVKADLQFTAAALALLDAQHAYGSAADDPSDPWYVGDEDIPDGWTQAADTAGRDKYGVAAKQLITMIGVPYDDARWVEFMNQLTWDEMADMVSSGLYSTPAVTAVNKPKTFDSDGPAQIGASVKRGFGFAAAVNIASAWNTELARLYGEMVGEDAQHGEWRDGRVITGWYGPAMNIHRSPFGGRNFEYYSEDGLLSGRMAAAVVGGAADKGLITYLKHFALGEQESDRSTQGGVCVWSNEQAMRELYLKPFELAVKEGGATGMMCSFNRVGGVPAAANYNLFVRLLEDEWGFGGLSVTDYYSGSSWGWPGNKIVRCHLFPMGNYDTYENERVEGVWDAASGRPLVGGEPSATHYYAVRTTAQRMMYAVANSNAFPNPDVDTSVYGDQAIEFNQGESSYAPLGFAGGSVEKTDGEVPEGLTFYSPSGDFAGAPKTAGKYKLTIKATQDNVVWYAEVALTVKSAFTVDNAVGRVGQPFAAQISWKYIPQEATIAVAEGSALPEGLSVDEKGKISGTPVKAGTYDVRLVATRLLWGEPDSYYYDLTLTVGRKTTAAVTFDGNYAGAENSTATVEKGAAVSAPAEPTRDGYAFGGWFTDAACTDPVDFTAAIADDVTYYAKWTKVEDRPAPDPDPGDEPGGCGSLLGGGAAAVVVLCGGGLLAAGWALVKKTKKK